MYEAEKIIRLAKRENNPHRDFLLINTLQSKHYPANPKDTIKMCEYLAKKIKTAYPFEKFLVIGFAEAATAIAALVANSLNSYYIQTTREILEDRIFLNFSEEHSHAKNQILYIDNFKELEKNADRIVFVEDEITTGKTLQNACRELQAICKKELKFTIATLLDCTHNHQKKELENLRIDIISLMQLNKDKFAEQLRTFCSDGLLADYSKSDILKLTESEKSALLKNVRQIHFKVTHDPRIGVHISETDGDLEKLWESFEFTKIPDLNKKFLVLGTEEFVYPAVFIGNKLSEFSSDVKCHATTRSPMLPSISNDYPLKNRASLPSLYEDGRKTFIYNVDKADCTIVLTDSHEKTSTGMYALLKILQDFGNTNIYWVWWIK